MYKCKNVQKVLQYVLCMYVMCTTPGMVCWTKTSKDLRYVLHVQCTTRKKKRNLSTTRKHVASSTFLLPSTTVRYMSVIFKKISNVSTLFKISYIELFYHHMQNGASGSFCYCTSKKGTTCFLFNFLFMNILILIRCVVLALYVCNLCVVYLIYVCV